MRSVLICLLVPGLSFAQEVDSERIPTTRGYVGGDANGDRTADISDVALIGRYAANEDVSIGCPAAADTDDNGVIDNFDQVTLFAYKYKHEGWVPNGDWCGLTDPAPDPSTDSRERIPEPEPVEPCTLVVDSVAGRPGETVDVPVFVDSGCGPVEALSYSIYLPRLGRITHALGADATNSRNGPPYLSHFQEGRTGTGFAMMMDPSGFKVYGTGELSHGGYHTLTIEPTTERPGMHTIGVGTEFVFPLVMSYMGRPVLVSATDAELEVQALPGVFTSSAILGVNESGSSASFSLGLTGPPRDDVTLTMVPSDASEISVYPEQLTFTPANWNRGGFVTVTGVDDDVADGTVRVEVGFSVSSRDAGYHGIGARVVPVDVADDDVAGITVAASGLSVSETGAFDVMSLVLDSEPVADVTVAFITDTAVGTALPGSVTFTAETWHVAQDVTVAAVNDDIARGDTPFTVGFAVTSTDAMYDGLAIEPVWVDRGDDDVAGVTVTAGAPLMSAESGTAATIELVLDTQPLDAVRVTFVPTDERMTIEPATATLDATNWSVSRVLTVTGPADVDADLSYFVDIGVSSVDPAYEALAVRALNGLHRNDVVPTDDSELGCGCQSSPSPVGFMGFGVLLLGVAARRRHSA